MLITIMRYATLLGFVVKESDKRRWMSSETVGPDISQASFIQDERELQV